MGRIEKILDKEFMQLYEEGNSDNKIAKILSNKHNIKITDWNIRYYREREMLIGGYQNAATFASIDNNLGDIRRNKNA